MRLDYTCSNVSDVPFNDLSLIQCLPNYSTDPYLRAYQLHPSKLLWYLERKLLHSVSFQILSSPWLALWYGMVSHWLSGHFLEYSPRNSFSNLKQHYSAAL